VNATSSLSYWHEHCIIPKFVWQYFRNSINLEERIYHHVYGHVIILVRAQNTFMKNRYSFLVSAMAELDHNLSSDGAMEKMQFVLQAMNPPMLEPGDDAIRVSPCPIPTKDRTLLSV
jgi:hypothetical protein